MSSLGKKRQKMERETKEQARRCNYVQKIHFYRPYTLVQTKIARAGPSPQVQRQATGGYCFDIRRDEPHERNHGLVDDGKRYSRCSFHNLFQNCKKLI